MCVYGGGGGVNYPPLSANQLINISCDSFQPNELCDLDLEVCYFSISKVYIYGGFVCGGTHEIYLRGVCGETHEIKNRLKFWLLCLHCSMC